MKKDESKLWLEHLMHNMWTNLEGGVGLVWNVLMLGGSQTGVGQPTAQAQARPAWSL